MMDEKMIIKALHHRKHDWLNDLQLILGYIQLGKLDRLKEVAQRMVVKTDKAGAYLRGNTPRLSIYLFVLESVTTDYELNIDLEQSYEFKGSDLALDRMLDWLDVNIKEITASAKTSYNEENRLYVKFEQLPDKWLVRLRFNDGQEVVGQGQLQWNEVE
ncbi:MAG: hypothetical protein RLZZ267_28 [Bacillota bacterium]|jgi:hypothetical protein